jgi:hypothetical protein
MVEKLANIGRKGSRASCEKCKSLNQCTMLPLTTGCGAKDKAFAQAVADEVAKQYEGEIARLKQA